MPDETEVEMIECADGESHPADDCVECSDGEFRLRDDCVATRDGDWIPSDEAITTANGQVFHQDDERVHYCEDGEYRTSQHCDQCCSCSEWFGHSDLVSSPGGHDSMCENCSSNETFCCDGCGNSYWNDDYGEDGYCQDCSSNRSTDGILGYHAHEWRVPCPYSVHKGEDLVGIELEIEARGSREECVDHVRAVLDDHYCILSEDGSLNNGFEIVTRPDSLAVHREMLGKWLDTNPGKVMKSFRTSTCGMHVHVSRKPRTDLQIGKIMVFLNSKENDEIITRIAGRPSNTYAHRSADTKLSDSTKRTGKFSPLNLKTHTIEFRIFRGNVSKIGVMRNLEFVEAILEFTATAARSCKDAVSAAKFVEWLPKKKFPLLHAHLKGA